LLNYAPPNYRLTRIRTCIDSTDFELKGVQGFIGVVNSTSLYETIPMFEIGNVTAPYCTVDYLQHDEFITELTVFDDLTKLVGLSYKTSAGVVKQAGKDVSKQ
jgi:hypothetical protein